MRIDNWVISIIALSGVLAFSAVIAKSYLGKRGMWVVAVVWLVLVLGTVSGRIFFSG